MSYGQLMWRPPEHRRKGSQIQKFIAYINSQFDLNIDSYEKLHGWSVKELNDFWMSLSKFVGTKWQKPPNSAVSWKPSSPLWQAQFFPNGQLNFAENLLPEPSEKVVLTAFQEGRGKRTFTSRQLYNQVSLCAQGLKKNGVKKGDVVGGILINGPEAIIAALAATSLGAVWTSCSPDFGEQAIVDRLSQVDPKLVFFQQSYNYRGKTFELTEKWSKIQQNLPHIHNWIIVGDNDTLQKDSWSSFLSCGLPDHPLEFAVTDFNHPVYVLFSSGTTGKPKGIIHSVGGTLLQHKKEHQLHCDLKAGDKMLFYTTCGWMMWNWLFSALASDVHIVLYDGAVFYPDNSSLWSIIREERVNVFGTSPKFLSACMNIPKFSNDLSEFPFLRSILSTGAPLLPEHSEWVYKNVKSDLHLASISGGTDIISCFMLGIPCKNVYSGEIQGPGLGMDVVAIDNQGKKIIGKKGELVCRKPFVSMPLGLINDKGYEKFKQTYFYGAMPYWYHGDFCEQTENGGFIMHGRSDATLNPGGVRIGTAEIYRVVEKVEGIEDSIAVGKKEKDGDTSIVLLVKLLPPALWSQKREEQLRAIIRNQLSPRHVPKYILPVDDIPYTVSGKKVEMAVKRILNHEDVPNKGALANPESLQAIITTLQVRNLLEHVS